MKLKAYKNLPIFGSPCALKQWFFNVQLLVNFRVIDE